MLCGTGFCSPLRRGWRGCRQLRKLHRGRGREDLAVTIFGAIGRAGYPSRGKARADLVVGLRGVQEPETHGGTPEIIIGEIVRVADLHHQDSEVAPLMSLVHNQRGGAVRAPSVVTGSSALEHRFSGLKSPQQFAWRNLGGSGSATGQKQYAASRKACSSQQRAGRCATSEPCSQRRAHRPFPIRRALDSALW
jgi:hypothetical protein